MSNVKFPVCESAQKGHTIYGNIERSAIWLRVLISVVVSSLPVCWKLKFWGPFYTNPGWFSTWVSAPQAVIFYRVHMDPGWQTTLPTRVSRFQPGLYRRLCRSAAQGASLFWRQTRVSETKWPKTKNKNKKVIVSASAVVLLLLAVIQMYGVLLWLMIQKRRQLAAAHDLIMLDTIKSIRIWRQLKKRILRRKRRR